LVAVTALIVAALAAGGWALLQPTAVGEHATVLHVRTSLPSVRYAIDGGEWRPLPAEAFATATGKHHLRLESTGGGPTLRCDVDVDLTEGQRRELIPTFATIPVQPVTVGVPGSGLLFIDGVAYGLDQNARLDKAGTYALTRRDLHGWQSLVANVDDRGALNSEGAAHSERPLADGYWCRPANGATATERFHIVCFWEADRARVRANIPPPPGWGALTSKVEQPVPISTIALVASLANSLAEDVVGDIPDHETASRMVVDHHAPVWYRDGGKFAIAADSQVSTGLVILVPR
jgi:hypothetical protein